MAPETRSRGVAPPSRVYHSSPVLQQIQFPSRRKKIRTYGRQTSDRLRQQTLTQIDFVSSFDDEDDDGVIVLTDSEAEDLDKENRNPEPPARDQPKSAKQTRGAGLQDEEHGNDEPTPSKQREGSRRKRSVPASTSKGGKSKRRRTLGDETDTSKADDDKSLRRRTLGDSPAASKFHTQTLTQFLGHRSLVADSDEDQDDEFLEWLGEQASPSLGRSNSAARHSPSHHASSAAPPSMREASASAQSREESVIPQTPVKRVPAIRFAVELDDVSGGLASNVERYGAPDVLTSPLKDRSSPAAPLPLELTGTPRRLEATRASVEARKDASSTRKNTIAGQNPDEIPDSDDEDGAFEQESEHGGDDAGEEEHDHCYGAGAETQLAMHALASSEEELLLDRPCPAQVLPSSTQSLQPKPDSSAAPEAIGSVSTSPSEPPSPEAQLGSAPPRPVKPIRKPLYGPPSSPPPSQPLESQRVPISILQSLPPHTARSDVLLPVGAPSLAALLGGHRVHVRVPFKIPDQVVRFWLLDGALLRHMACVDAPGEAARDGDGNAGWRYYVRQVYELNNPVEEDDMREEGWVDGPVAKYVYLPPAVVGQLLWNLRHALFRDDADEAAERGDGDGARERQRRLARGDTPASDDVTVSQQVAAQIRSDIAHSTQFVPSTQGDDNGGGGGDDGLGEAGERLPPSSSAPCQPPSWPAAATLATSPCLPPPPPPARPSQATTASQSSTPERQQHHPAGRRSLGSANLLPLLDHYHLHRRRRHHDGAASSPPSLPEMSASQLLSKSQLLSESLVRDHSPPPPPEIWNSDDDDAPL